MLCSRFCSTVAIGGDLHAHPGRRVPAPATSSSSRRKQTRAPRPPPARPPPPPRVLQAKAPPPLQRAHELLDDKRAQKQTSARGSNGSSGGGNEAPAILPVVVAEEERQVPPVPPAPPVEEPFLSPYDEAHAEPPSEVLAERAISVAAAEEDEEASYDNGANDRFQPDSAEAVASFMRRFGDPVWEGRRAPSPGTAGQSRLSALRVKVDAAEAAQEEALVALREELAAQGVSTSETSQEEEEEEEEEEEAALFAQEKADVEAQASQLAASLPPSDLVELSRHIYVTFQLRLQVSFGCRVALVGSSEALGRWSSARAVVLHWNPGDVWRSAPVALSVHTAHCYKYAIVGEQGGVLSWQAGANNVLVVDQEDAPRLAVQDSWNCSPQETAVLTADGQRQAPCQRLSVSMQRREAALQAARAQASDAARALAEERVRTHTLRAEARVAAEMRNRMAQMLNEERRRAQAVARNMGAFRDTVQRVRDSLAEKVDALTRQAR